MANNNKPKPWERQEKETPKQFEAFAIYRDLGGERSLARVSEELGKSETLMARWSSMNSWVDRCAAWDDERDRLLRIQQQKDIAAMRKRHASMASSMLKKAAKALSELKESDMSPVDIARFVSEASKLERISRGDVGDVVEERHGEDSVSPVKIYLPDNHRGDSESNDECE